MIIFVISITTLILIQSMNGQFSSSCDYVQVMTVGTSYDVFSPNYSNSYPANINCRWRAQAPAGYTITINCPDIAIPYSNGCVNDKLQISYTGDPNLADAQTICTSGYMGDTVTTSNLISIALRVPSSTSGGRFLCNITTTPVTSSTCDCGRKKTSRIVGGTETYTNEYPEMAGLVLRTESTIICGATIISDQLGVTAAHCLVNRVATDLALLVGDQDFTISTDTPYSALYVIGAYTYHNEYSSSQNQNDIGIVQTQTSMTFNPGVGPACLPYKYASTSFVGIDLVATGWGTTSYGGSSSTTLMKVGLNVISNDQCSKIYPNAISTGQICTYTPNKDTCQQDSGGPLFYTDSNNVVYNIGIVSYGIACATTNPSVSTNVGQYLSWIESQTPGVTYCKK